jgi:lipoprotein-releasing system permease protein
MLAFKIAKRFRGSKQQSGFISFVSASSTIGIGLGCFVLILLLSVMNGFEKELRETLLSYIPHAEFIAVDSRGVYLDETTKERAANDPRVVSLLSYTKAAGLIQKSGKMKSVEVQGIDAEYLKNKPALNLLPKAFVDNPKGIYLGKGIAEQLELNINDKVQLLLPQTSDSMAFVAPKSLWLSYLGSLNFGGDVDDFVGIMNKQTLSFALNLQRPSTNIEFQLVDPFLGREVVRDYGQRFNQVVYMSDWTLTNGHLYQDIQLVRVVVYITLTLVICIACFNIVSSLVMSVKEKRSEIAMLKTMGAHDNLIRRVFVIKGLVNGVYGATTGTTLGVLCSLYLPVITDFIENTLGFTLLGEGVYFIDYLPSDLQTGDVVITYLVAICLCVVATLYPASRAVRVNPARELQ